MTKPEADPEREDRIAYEAIVDCYNEQEQAMGWYYYLADKCHFPFTARCFEKRGTSPLKLKEEVEVIEMAPEEECEHEMFVVVSWKGEELDVPLSQLEPIDADGETQEAVDDWCYWVNQGYRL